MNAKLSHFVIGVITVVLLSGSFLSIHGDNSSQYSESHSGTVAPYSSGSSLQTITFQATGLAPGTTWSATVTNNSQNLAFGKGTVLTSTTDKILFRTGPGTYYANFYAVGPYLFTSSYSFTVGAESYTLKVPFVDQYSVQVTATGLPGNVTLGLSLTGGFYQNYMNGGGYGYAPASNTVSKLVINGTYRVMAGELLSNGGYLFGYIGNVTVNGSGVNLAVAFHRVILSESGLPSNVSWGFQGQAVQLLNGNYFPPDKLCPGLNSTVTVYVPTGSTFLQPVAKGYYNPGFYVNITSGNISRVVQFQKEYPVVFNSNFQILPMGTYWTIGGVPYTFDGSPAEYSYQSSFIFYLPNGTYNISVILGDFYAYETVNGIDYHLNYTYSISDRNLTVNGHGTTISVAFNVTKKLIPSPTNLALFFTAGAIIAGSVFAAAMLYRERKKK